MSERDNMRLSQKQREIVEATNHTIIVNSNAAVGKTALISERVKYLLNKGEDSKKIVVITFTTNAAEEMKIRLGDRLEDCFVGTIHSYANHLLMRAGFDTMRFLQEEKFDVLFEEVKKLDHFPEVKYLILDEAQDTDSTQWEFILEDIKPEYLFAVGDIRQELYGFRGSDVKTFLNLQNREDAKMFYLNENYRNGYDILRYAKWIMDRKEVPPEYADNSVWKSGIQGKVVRRQLDYNWIAEEIRRHDDYRDWFILTRDNQQLQRIKSELEKRKIPCSSFLQGDLTKDELAYEMNKNTVKVLTIHASKGLERTNVMVYGARYNSKEEICCTYVAVTRAKERLYMLSAPKHVNKTVNWE